MVEPVGTMISRSPSSSRSASAGEVWNVVPVGLGHPGKTVPSWFQTCVKNHPWTTSSPSGPIVAMMTSWTPSPSTSAKRSGD